MKILLGLLAFYALIKVVIGIAYVVSCFDPGAIKPGMYTRHIGTGYMFLWVFILIFCAAFILS